MVVYPGGLCSGDTPTNEIETSGAAGKTSKSDNRVKDEQKDCPFYRDVEMPFAARHMGLSLDTLQPEDCPRGPVQHTKDYQSSLMTEDLYRAQPVLGHPTTANSAPVPWKSIQKPPPEEIPGSCAKAHYPELRSSRPRDMALTTSDIEKGHPQRIGGNCEGRTRLDQPVDPLSPAYKLLGNVAQPPPSPRSSGRCTLNVTDIEGATPRATVPVRTTYGNPLKVENEFRSRRHVKALAEIGARALGMPTPTNEEKPSADLRCAGTPRLEGPKRSARCTDPLDPKYCVPLPVDTPGTSLCCSWAEEQRFMGASISVGGGEIGHVHGSMPKAGHHAKDAPYFTLETSDVIGAQSQRRVGAVPYSMYGPYGNRRNWSASLDTTDVQGAQADTLERYPKVSCKKSARNHVDGDGLGSAAKGKPLQSSPEKV